MRSVDTRDETLPAGTVLVISDDRAVLAEVEAALQDVAYAVLTTVTANAVVIAHAFRPDMIVIDLADEEHLAVSRRLHADPVTARIPRIGLLGPSSWTLSPMDASVDDVVHRPINGLRLYGTLARWSRVS